jgi:WD40 repeat protein
MKIESIGHFLHANWSPCGKYIAAGNSKDVLVVLDAEKGEQVAKVKCLNQINELAWSINSDHLLISRQNSDHGGGIFVVNFVAKEGTMREMFEVAGHAAEATFLKIDNKFENLVVGSKDHTISIWDVDDLVCHNMITNLEADIKDISLSGTGSLVAVTLEGLSLFRIYNVSDGKLAMEIPLKQPLNSLAWHPKGHFIALACDIQPNSLGLKERAGGSGSSFLKLCLLT